MCRIYRPFCYLAGYVLSSTVQCVILFITVCVYQCRNSERCGRMWTKFSGPIACETGTNWLNFKHPLPEEKVPMGVLILFAHTFWGIAIKFAVITNQGQRKVFGPDYTSHLWGRGHREPIVAVQRMYVHAVWQEIPNLARTPVKGRDVSTESCCGCFVVVEDVRRFECTSSKMVGLQQFSVTDAVVSRWRCFRRTQRAESICGLTQAYPVTSVTLAKPNARWVRVHLIPAISLSCQLNWLQKRG